VRSLDELVELDHPAAAAAYELQCNTSAAIMLLRAIRDRAEALAGADRLTQEQV
jgi:hypothetical protein